MTNLQTRFVIALFAIWIVGQGCIPAAMAQTGDVALVVNEKNPIDNLTSPEVRKIFAGEKHLWAGGLPIKLFVRASGARERVVLLKVLRMSEIEYKEYWSSKVFRGEAQAEPIALFSNGMQKEALLAYPGGVALVNAQDVKLPMKVVKVDGRMPGEPGYPLN
jgi:hypothetical protein